MPRATANGIELEYETFGDPAHEPVLLIMGLSCQMLLWPEGFCELLAGRGYHVVRYDNRDVGGSTSFDDAPMPNLAAIFAGDPSTAPYLISDMAADARGLLDSIGIDEAHVVGQSMGGMITQALAIEHPERLRSLCSISSTTGDRSVGQPSPEIMGVLITPPPSPDRDGAAAQHVTMWRALGSTAWPFDEDYVRERGGRCFDRGPNPMGTLRQMAAIAASPDRTEGLRNVDKPALVIHGDIDPLVHVSGGEATAKAIPGAELLVLPGMGHDLPAGAWSTLVDAIVANFERSR